MSRNSWIISLFLILSISARSVRSSPPADRGDEETARSAIAAIAENELLYQNLDIDYNYTYKLTMPMDHFHGTFPPDLRREDRYHVVVQGRFYRIDGDGTIVTHDGKAHPTHSKKMFDGSFTRMIDADRANIHSDRLEIEEDSALFPYRLGFSVLQGRLFSDHLTDRKGANAFMHHRTVVHNSAKAGELIGGLETVQMFHQVDRFIGENHVYTRYDFIWLVPSRNWLPIRSEIYERFHRAPAIGGSLELPNVISKADGWKEIQPGVWTATRDVSESWELGDLAKGLQTPGTYREIHINKITLDPHYPESYFRSINFPDGTAMYEAKGGVITKSYVIGLSKAKKVRAKMFGITLERIVQIAIVLIIVSSFWYFFSRRKRKSFSPSDRNPHV